MTNQTEVYTKTLKRVLQYLSHRDRSEYEITKTIDKYLNKTETPADKKTAITNALLEKLKDLRLMDDSKLAESYILDVINSTKPKGSLAIKAYLYKKGIPKDIIKTALEKDYPENTEIILATKVATKFWQRMDTNKLFVSKKKLISHLKTKGFNPNIIYTAVDVITKKD